MAQQPSSRSRDLDKLILRPGLLVGSDFVPGPDFRDDLKEYARVLVVGAGGLGCELLKDLALSGFLNLHVIDMDRIEVSNLNRQFLFRLEDVGKPKAEVAAKRVMERICRIEDEELDFYNDFSIIVLGLDSIEAWGFINGVACGFLGLLCQGSLHAFSVLFGSFHRKSSFLYVLLRKPQELLLIALNMPTKLSGMRFIVGKLLIPIILNICSGSIQRYNGVEGLHTKVTEFVKDKDCLICGPGILIELDTSVTLRKFRDLLEDHPKLLLSRASVTHRGNNLYMQAPPVLEQMTRYMPLFDLLDKIPKDIVHVSGTAGKGDEKQSCMRKARVVFKGIDGVTDMDTAGGAQLLLHTASGFLCHWIRILFK